DLHTPAGRQAVTTLDTQGRVVQPRARSYTQKVRNPNPMALTKVGPKYQVPIPKEAREAVGLAVGDLVDATPTKDGVRLRPPAVIPKSALAALQQAKRSGTDKLSR